MIGSIWTTLGLEPTSDISAIKRAYAAQLKAIDLDDDPTRFQAIREARDIAISLAQSDAFDAAQAREDEADEVSVAAEIVPAELEPVDPDEARLQEDHRALCAILFQIHDDRFYPATPEESEAMLAHFRAILANPRMQDVGTLSNAAPWFAGAIAQMIPRSDVLVEPAMTAFGWTGADTLGHDPMIAHVVERQSDLAFMAELDQPRHKLHKAWLELKKPADEYSRRGSVSVRKVHALLGDIRSNHPSVESGLDWYRVSLWDQAQPTSVMDWLSNGIGLLIAFSVFTTAYMNSTSPSQSATGGFPDRASAYAGLSDADGDIDAMLKAVTGQKMGGEQLKAGNPKLYRSLESDWRAAQAAGTDRSTYLSDSFEGIDDHVHSLWSYAPSQLLDERYRLKRDVGVSLASATAEACETYFKGDPAQLYGNQIQRSNQLVANELLAIDPEKTVPSHDGEFTRFTIPGNVIDKIGKKLGEDGKGVGKALSGDLGTRPYCKAQLALLDAVLALPEKDRTRILRDMSVD